MHLTFFTGPLIPEFSILAIITIFFYAIFTKKIIVSNSLFILVSFLVCLILILSFLLLYSSDTVYGSFLFYFRFPMYSFILFYTLKKNPSFLKYFYIFIGILLFLISIEAITQFITKVNFLGLEAEVQNRISGVFGDEYILGKYLFFSYCIYYYIHFKNEMLFRHQKILFLINSFLIGTSIFISGERTSMILFTLFSSMSIFFYDKLKLRAKLLIYFIFPFVFFFIISFNSSYFERFIPQFDWSIDILKSPHTFLSSSNSSFYYNFMYYYDFAIVSIKMFVQDPFFGVGPKMYRVDCLNYINEFQFACSTHPHNTYLQLLSETGIFLSIIVIFLWLVLSAILIRQKLSLIFKNQKKYDYPFICLVISYFVFLFPFLPSNSIFNNNSSILLFSPLGFLLYEIFSSKNINRKLGNLKIIE